MRTYMKQGHRKKEIENRKKILKFTHNEYRITPHAHL